MADLIVEANVDVVKQNTYNRQLDEQWNFVASKHFSGYFYAMQQVVMF